MPDGAGTLLDHDLRRYKLSGGGCVVDDDPDLEPHFLALPERADGEGLVGSE